MIAPATSLLRRPVPAILSRRALIALGLAVAFASAGCDKVPLTAPTGSTVTLFSNTTIVPVNGAADITATVIESGGTQVQNGTLVTFTTTIGQIDPAEARTHDGKVTVRLLAGDRSGRAVVRAFSGGITSGDLSVDIGGAAAGSINLTANPSNVPASGSTSALLAVVFDADGNRLPGVSVSFTSTAGALSSTVVITNSQGEAATTITTNRDATVTASTGGSSGERRPGGGHRDREHHRVGAADRDDHPDGHAGGRFADDVHHRSRRHRTGDRPFGDRRLRRRHRSDVREHVLGGPHLSQQRDVTRSPRRSRTPTAAAAPGRPWSSSRHRRRWCTLTVTSPATTTGPDRHVLRDRDAAADQRAGPVGELRLRRRHARELQSTIDDATLRVSGNFRGTGHGGLSNGQTTGVVEAAVRVIEGVPFERVEAAPELPGRLDVPPLPSTTPSSRAGRTRRPADPSR